MKASDQFPATETGLTASLRILTGLTHNGRKSIYISGSPDGLRYLAEIILHEAAAVEGGAAGNGSFTKLDRSEGTLAVATADSIDVFEVHCAAHVPEPH